MRANHPSDRLLLPGVAPPMTVGEARDFLESPDALANPSGTVTVARALSQIVHKLVDFTEDGHVIVAAGSGAQLDVLQVLKDAPIHLSSEL